MPLQDAITVGSFKNVELLLHYGEDMCPVRQPWEVSVYPCTPFGCVVFTVTSSYTGTTSCSDCNITGVLLHRHPQ